MLPNGGGETGTAHGDPQMAATCDAHETLVLCASTAEAKFLAVKAKADYDALRSAYDKLLEAVTDGKTGPGKAPETLCREKYPDVVYWSQEDWKQHDRSNEILLDASSTRQRGKSRAAKNINVMMTFVETAEGVAVNGYYAIRMRKKARSIWNQWKEDKRLKRTWSQVPQDQLAFYELSMESEFPELGFCSHHWKAHEVARIIYPNFIRDARLKETKSSAKSDDGPISSENSDASNSGEHRVSQKRCAKTSKVARTAKKARPSEQSDVGDVVQPVRTGSRGTPQQVEKSSQRGLPRQEATVLGNSAAGNAPVVVEENIEIVIESVTTQRQACAREEQDKENTTDALQGPGGSVQKKTAHAIVNPLANACQSQVERGVGSRRESAQEGLTARNKGRQAGTEDREVPQEGTSNEIVERAAAHQAAEKVKYKRPNGSLSVKNLFLIDLGNDGARVTAEEFEKKWLELGAEGHKKYADASKEAKAKKK
ncbi:hypothetical protein CERSUDRAFT_98781 [Gelatoporia subvermispora B]|uniref:Uncharacterized protein n=1 Tax=Ceriporiopsis subvermispora (strain B) TaxID=914234 RepID=M2R2Q3_CERS8|nr:hypothetical protein CERSUDRAFT_98781 [Gelatoporia subvermispora B]